jgi:hypothetical protein
VGGAIVGAALGAGALTAKKLGKGSDEPEHTTKEV